MKIYFVLSYLQPLDKFEKKNKVHYLIIRIGEHVKARVLKNEILGEKEKEKFSK